MLGGQAPRRVEQGADPCDPYLRLEPEREAEEFVGRPRGASVRDDGLEREFGTIRAHHDHRQLRADRRVVKTADDGTPDRGRLDHVGHDSVDDDREVDGQSVHRTIPAALADRANCDGPEQDEVENGGAGRDVGAGVRGRGAVEKQHRRREGEREREPQERLFGDADVVEDGSSG